MSAISEKVRKALYTKLNVTGVTTLATNGVHFMIAPKRSTAPFVLFSRVPQNVQYALADNLVVESDLWLIKAVTDEDSSTSKSPVALAEEILTACETAIGGTLTLSTGKCLMARRVNEIPNYMETVSDRVIHHHGFWLQVISEP